MHVNGLGLTFCVNVKQKMCQCKNKFYMVLCNYVK